MGTIALNVQIKNSDLQNFSIDQENMDIVRQQMESNIAEYSNSCANTAFFVNNRIWEALRPKGRSQKENLANVHRKFHLLLALDSRSWSDFICYFMWYYMPFVHIHKR